MNYEEVKIKIQQIARMSNRAIDLLPLMNSIDQLEADAELGRAVKKAFNRNCEINIYDNHERVEVIINKSNLLEWAKEVE